MKQSNTQNKIIGVYKYADNQELEGMSVMTENYFIFTGRNNNKFSTVDSTDLYENKYNSLFLQAGTYDMQDSIITSNLLYAKNPTQEGTSYRWAYSLTGDTIVTGFVNKNNEVIRWSDYSIKLE